jgi:hypothetical protein
LNTDESNHALVRGLSTLQRHVSIRLQNISSHLKKDTSDMILSATAPTATATTTTTSHHVIETLIDKDQSSSLKQTRADVRRTKLKQQVNFVGPVDVIRLANRIC